MQRLKCLGSSLTHRLLRISQGATDGGNQTVSKSGNLQQQQQQQQLHYLRYHCKLVIKNWYYYCNSIKYTYSFIIYDWPIRALASDIERTL